MTSSHLVELEKSELEFVLEDSSIRLDSNSIPCPFTNQCKKNISKIGCKGHAIEHLCVSLCQQIRG